MKNTAILLFVLLLPLLAAGQEMATGTVSYVTAQNVYVRFSTTGGINPGDTLFATGPGGESVPALIVREASSISCVCIRIGNQAPVPGDRFTARLRPAPGKETTPGAVTTPPPAKTDSPAAIPAKARPVGTSQETQSITGNAGIASYLNFSDMGSNVIRMKYHLSFAIRNIGNSKLSAETNMTFAHKSGGWGEIKEDVFNGLKIYSLAISYRPNAKNSLWLGRKINPRIANAGAIDGLQYEFKPGAVSFGAFAGTRPDYETYGFNPGLLQFGAYAGHDLNGKNGPMQTTLAFVDQLNGGNTDRQFAYLQHTNNLVKNLYFFGSAEMDLYRRTMNPVDTVLGTDTTYSSSHQPSLSNLYLSLRYRPVRKLSLTLSYSARQNVIYYETYRNFVDRMLEESMLQGFAFQAGYQPARWLSLGLQAGYRYRNDDPRSTRNLHGYLTFNNIPGTGINATVAATLLETGYLGGSVYSLSLQRDMASGKVSASLGYRYADYNFTGNQASLHQHVAEANITWRILRKLSCGAYYEGTFDDLSPFSRVYLYATQRF